MKRENDELNRGIQSNNDRYTITIMMTSTIFIILLLLPIITTSYIINQWKRGDSLLSRRSELSSLYVTQDSYTASNSFAYIYDKIK